MIKFRQFAIITVLFTSALYSQTQTSKLFYSGKDWPLDIFLWIWGFSELPVEVPNMGYTPGTPAFRWGTELTWRDNQGLFFGYHDGVDLSNPGNDDFVQFKLRAPDGVYTEPPNIDHRDNLIPIGNASATNRRASAKPSRPSNSPGR